MKRKRIMSILLVVVILFAFGSVFAISGPGDIIIGNTDLGEMKGLSANILGAIRSFGYILAVGMLLIYGIKYILATANEKADLKKGFVHYVIGAVLLAGATTIASWIFSMVEA